MFHDGDLIGVGREMEIIIGNKSAMDTQLREQVPPSDSRIPELKNDSSWSLTPTEDLGLSTLEAGASGT